MVWPARNAGWLGGHVALIGDSARPWVAGLSLCIALGLLSFNRAAKQLEARLEVERTLSGFAPVTIPSLDPAEQLHSSVSYVERLPHSAARESVITLLAEAGRENAVTITSLSVSTRAPTSNTLGREDVSIVLRGSYGDIRRTLAALRRAPEPLVLTQLSLRSRSAAEAAVEATVALTLLSRPTSPNAAAK